MCDKGKTSYVTSSYILLVIPCENKHIAGDSGRKVNILGNGNIGHCEKKFLVSTCLILNGYRDRAVRISRPNSAGFLFVTLDEERSLQNKSGYKRQTALSHFACYCLHKEM
jgi:hypothetical protein